MARVSKTDWVVTIILVAACLTLIWCIIGWIRDSR